MTAQPLRRPAEHDRLRVLKGRRLLRPSVAPWTVMALIGVIAFLGLGFARTSLDSSAFELSKLDRAIEREATLNERLKLELARLESPARIAPLAQELGLVIPSDTNQLLVDLDPVFPLVAGAEGQGRSQ